MNTVKEAAPVAAALVTGIAVGGVFALLRVTPPAPSSWAAIAGIVGIFLGATIVSAVVK